jgi:hypothetical protein
MRQLTPGNATQEDREPPLRIWRRGLYLTPPQLKFAEHRPADGGLLVRLSALWSRLLGRR